MYGTVNTGGNYGGSMTEIKDQLNSVDGSITEMGTSIEKMQTTLESMMSAISSLAKNAGGYL